METWDVSGTDSVSPRETKTARITRQSRDEQSITMRTSVALWCKGRELRSIQVTEFYAVVDAADYMPVPLVSMYSHQFVTPYASIPLQVQVQVPTGN
jgi:uncharacterized protein